MQNLAIFCYEIIQPRYHAIGLVLQDQRSAIRNADLETVFSRHIVRDSEEQQGDVGARFPVAFHCRHLRRLVLKRVQAVNVTGKDLDRDQTGTKDHAERERGPYCLRAVAHKPAKCRDARNQESTGQPGRQQHVHETVGHRGVEDDGPPIRCMGNAIDHLETGGRVHPAVENEDPERGHGGAEGNEEGRERVQPIGDTGRAKQHDAKKYGFYDKYKNFVAWKIPTSDGRYRGLTADVPSWVDTTLLVANPKAPEDLVYGMLKAIFTEEGLAWMVSQKKTFKAMSVEKGIKGVATPLHPGAEKFWKEMGVLK